MQFFLPHEGMSCSQMLNAGKMQVCTDAPPASGDTVAVGSKRKSWFHKGCSRMKQAATQPMQRARDGQHTHAEEIVQAKACMWRQHCSAPSYIPCMSVRSCLQCMQQTPSSTVSLSLFASVSNSIYGNLSLLLSIDHHCMPRQLTSYGGYVQRSQATCLSSSVSIVALQSSSSAARHSTTSRLAAAVLVMARQL